MSLGIDAPLLGSFFVAGLAGSLHCIGMCGPLLAAYSGTAPAVTGRSSELWVHAGRIWTYAILGLVIGRFGEIVRAGSALAGWQRTAGILLGVGIVIAGLLVTSGPSREGALRSRAGCAFVRLGRHPWLRALLVAPGVLPRVLVGAALGLIPCGLVYAMLVAAAALPTPLHAAAGMLVFGLGTVPGLSLALLARGLLPDWIRARGTTSVGIVLVLSGLFVMARSAVAPLHHHHGGDAAALHARQS